MIEWLVEFPDAARIPLETWVDWFFEDLLLARFGWLFAAVRNLLLAVLIRIEQFLLWLPWSVIVAATAIAGWRSGGWRLATGATLGLVFIGALGLWTQAMATLSIVVVAVVAAVAVGVPVGVAMARSGVVSTVARPVLDLMQTMPSFVYLVPVIMLFRIGRAPGLIATFVYAIPPVIRLTELGIRQVPGETVEAARAFGSSPRQTLLKVQLPLAFPTIMAGVNQTTMMALAMVIIASLVGAGGLGDVVLGGLGRLEVGAAFAAGLAIVVLAIVLDRMSQSFAVGSGVPKRSTGA